MVPILFTLAEGLSLMIIPDTEAHLDGHTILTHTYSIFRDNGKESFSQVRSKESTLHLERINDPDYYGYIVFEKPGQLFHYIPGDKKRLTPDEVEQVIERLSHLRDNPSTWQHLTDL